MKFILGKKLAMTHIFNKDNEIIPVTKIQSGPCLVVQVKSKDNDGYNAIQVGFETRKKINKASQGHVQGLLKKNENTFKYLREFRINDSKLKKGDIINVDIFKVGDMVKILGKTKGRGFQGVVKRHGFHGSPASHGHKDQLRMPGSIGATGPARVFKGKKMPGRMGNNFKTVYDLKIVKIFPKENIILVKGSIPGARNSLLKIVEA
ncbi:50S ribosomal protein L3 [Patescibacteria group bacterium]|nr:50S ribosomal protein L3 [Patescibacteria group bacterium]